MNVPYHGHINWQPDPILSHLIFHSTTTDEIQHLQPTNLSIKFSFNSNLMTKITGLQRASVNFDTYKEYQME